MTVLITPTPGGEEWKYTNTDEITSIPFSIAPLFPANQDDELSIDMRPPVLAIDAHIITIVNGHLQELPEPLPGGVNLSENDQSIITLKILENTVLEKPLHIVFMAHNAASPIAFYPKINIDVGQSSNATIVESHIGYDEAIEGDLNAYFSNPVMTLKMGENAKIKHYKLQKEHKKAYHIGLTEIDAEKNVDYEYFIAHTGSKITRNEVRVLLSGEKANCNINGAYITSDKMHIDNTTFVDHAVPNANSNQVFKGILDGKSRGVYQGKVLVRKYSQKTDGRQLHKALLLSDKAETNCKPELIIYADDVSCAHGASSGELDDEQIFYMRARGLDENQARKMLINAFLDDVIANISDEDIRTAFKIIIDESVNEHL